MEAATVLSLIGASFLVGRILVGRVSDSTGRKKTAIGCALIMALAMIWLIWSQDLWMLYIFGVVFGFANGGLDTSMAALVGDTFGTRSIGVIMGALQAGWGIGLIIGPAIGGLVFDVKDSYFLAFLVAMLAILVIALFVALTRREMGEGKPVRGEFS
jgi:MFS family permease